MVADNMYLVFRENNSVLGVIGCGQGDDCSIGKKYRKQNDGFTTSPTLSSPGGVFEVQHRSVSQNGYVNVSTVRYYCAAQPLA